MPLKRCSSDNKSGWKWGDSGHCYTGPDAKSKAIKQGYAANKGNKDKFKKELAKANLLRDPDIIKFLKLTKPFDKYIIACQSITG